MTTQQPNHVFFSYSEENEDFVEALALRLRSDARLSFWFAPWHSRLDKPFQDQMEEALEEAQVCAIFIGGGEKFKGWQNEEMRAAIQLRVEDDSSVGIIPVFVPGATRPKKRELPRFLRRYFRPGLEVEFRNIDDDRAFKRLLAGILRLPPIEVEGYLQTSMQKAQLHPPPSGEFKQGHALVIGIANYPKVRPLPEIVLNDARDLRTLLTDKDRCGYPSANVAQLLDGQATANGIRTALTDLAARTTPDDTAVIFFSGHGAYNASGGSSNQYIMPYDCDPKDLPGTAITGQEMTERLRKIKAGRLLVLFDCCHSGGAADPKSLMPQMKHGLSEAYYQALAQGKGRIVIASSRPDELSWVLPGMPNSLFTHYLLEALRGKGPTLGDGYVRAFDLFRYLADHVTEHLATYAARYPTHPILKQATQHPIFKATMETDFPIAFAKK